MRLEYAMLCIALAMLVIEIIRLAKELRDED